MFTRVTASRSALRAGRHLQTAGKRGKVTLPELQWDFGALEPHIAGKINELHYTKHHQTYATGLNTALEQVAETQSALERAPRDPKLVLKLAGLQQNVKFHGGGFVNHCMFWANLAPAAQGGGDRPAADSPLGRAIAAQFGSHDALQKRINAVLAGIQGSGWAFLVADTTSAAGATLSVRATPNQDTIVPGSGLVPLLAIDAWEHAYYLQYQNRKAEYFDAIWNVINWKEVEKRYADAQL